MSDVNSPRINGLIVTGVSFSRTGIAINEQFTLSNPCLGILSIP